MLNCDGKGLGVNEEKIQRSQTDLLVFISSCQDAEMEPARKAANRAIDEFPLTRPWAFENMPASSQSAREYYLQNAAVAHSVIWLIGDRTTQPVIDEIHTCMSVRGRLIAFKLPSQARCEQTKLLIDEVSAYAKWRTLKSLDHLADHIIAAISDDILHTVHQPNNRPGRAQFLIAAREESIHRCRQSWTTLGVPHEIAEKLSRDQSIGDQLALPTQGIQTIIGDQGVGKTLAAHRLFQKAVSIALDDSSKPFPVFVRARDLTCPLKEHVESVTQGFAFPAIQGALVIVDGLDEVGKDAANRLRYDINPYVSANQGVSIIITSRTLPGLRIDAQRVCFQNLGQERVLDLLSTIAGRTVESRELHSWPPSIQDAVRRPLFAVMIGCELRMHDFLEWANPAQVIERVAGRALSEAGTRQNEAEKLLQRLAVEAIGSGDPVYAWRVDRTLAAQHLLMDSRLVSEDAGKLDFTLPIFREWFAARALVEGAIRLDDIQPISVQWAIPIAIAIYSENEPLARSIMTDLAGSDPGIASLVLEEAERSAPAFMGNEQLPPGAALDLGNEIHQSMEDWGRGLGPLKPIICPVKGDGSISTLGVRVGPSMIKTSWYRGTGRMAPVVDIPTHFNRFEYNPDWSGTRYTTVRSTRTWPWLLTKEMLVESLSDKLKSRRFALQSSDAVREFAHEFASEVVQRRITTRSRVNIGDVIRYIDERTTTIASVGIGDLVFRPEDIRLIRRHLVQLSSDGEEFISDPWPGLDVTGPRIGGHRAWHDGFTQQQLLARTKAVYAAALRIYKHIVDSWFGAFAKSLRLNRLLPVRLEGRLIVPGPSDQRNDRPFINWWPRPVSEGETSQVAFELASPDYVHQHATRLMIETAEQESFKRGDVFWSQTTALHLHHPRPATELAHEWLIEELQELNWATVDAL